MNNAQSTYLDLLRVIAAQLVLIGHIYSTVNVGQTLGVGDLGVIVFFILSGFLISYSAIKKKEKNNYQFIDYVSDRLFRIYVPYIPALILVFMIDFYVINNVRNSEYLEYFNLKNFIASIFMIQQHPLGIVSDQLLGMSSLKLSTFGSARPWWTVANEWWLYMAFGLIYFTKINKVTMPILLFILVVPVFNSIAGTGEGLSLIWIMMALSAFLYIKIGGNDYVDSNLLAKHKAKHVLILVMLALFFMMLVRIVWISKLDPNVEYTRPFFYDFNFYVLMVLFLSAIFILLSRYRDARRNHIIRFMADYSYTLYLIHYSILFLLYAIGFIDKNNYVNQIISFIGINIFSIFMYFLFEHNYKRIQKKFESFLKVLLSNRR